MPAPLALWALRPPRAAVCQQEEIPLLRDNQHQLPLVPAGQRKDNIGCMGFCHYSTSPSMLVRISGSPSVIAMVFS